MRQLRAANFTGLACFIAGSFVVGTSLLQACTSKFSGCESARDCPANGDAGEAGQTNSASQAGTSSGGSKSDMSSAGASGEAGAAGANPVVTCIKDSDCSDGLACNGIEKCESGVCEPGTSPCTNPDAANCDVVCDEANGKATCGARGQDSDGDGHFSSACTANPGDDCNDTKATVHPGAPELCDQIDNDCNGKIDVADGLPAGGKTVEIGPAGATKLFPHVAWSPVSGAYGIAYLQYNADKTSGLYFEEIGPGNKTVLVPMLVNSSKTSPIHYDVDYDIGLTWGRDAFAVTWSSAGLEFQTIGFDGGLAPGSELDTDQLSGSAVARNADGTWGVVFEEFEGPGVSGAGDIGTETISALGVVTFNNPLGQGQYGSGWAIASSGSNFAVGYNLYPNGAAVRILSAKMSPIADVGVLYSPVIAGDTRGFMIAGRSSSQSTTYSVSLYSATGVQQCGPLAFPAGFAPASISATKTGYIALSTMLEAVEITSDCKLGTKFTVDTPSKAVTNAQISAGDTSYGIVWQDPADNKPKMRIIGPHYCD